VDAHSVDDLPLAGDQRGEIDRPRLRGDAGEATLSGAMASLGRREQRLGRDATDVDASPADRPALDHDDAQFLAPRGDGGRERTATRADDREVELDVAGFAHQQGFE
jgi:hypothetical protein